MAGIHGYSSEIESPHFSLARWSVECFPSEWSVKIESFSFGRRPRVYSTQPRPPIQSCEISCKSDCWFRPIAKMMNSSGEARRDFAVQILSKSEVKQGMRAFREVIFLPTHSVFWLVDWFGRWWQSWSWRLSPLLVVHWCKSLVIHVVEQQKSLHEQLIDHLRKLVNSKTGWARGPEEHWARWFSSVLHHLTEG